MPPAPLPEESLESLRRASSLLAMQGSYGLRSQAQQQAALELLQARRLGAADRDLEAVLLDRIRSSLMQLLRESPPPPQLGSAPCAPEFTLSISDLDGWVFHRSLRRYQQLIVDQIPFALHDEGTIYEVIHCRASVNDNRLMMRRRSDGAAYELVSSSCGTGFGLEGQRPQPLEAAAEAEPPLQGPPVLRIGDQNFAHFIWNELDPLLQLAQLAQRRGDRLAVVQDSCSIIDLAGLPGLELQPAELLRSRPSVHVGAMWVSDAVRRSVLSALAAPLQGQRRPDQPPLVLLGVRGPGRRELIDEEDLLIGLIARLQHRWPGLRIALDGFTLQRNHSQDPPARRRAEAIGERIARIQKACGPSCVESLHGLPFEAYLPRVAEACAYVTHEGTIQHKIGWFYPQIPGICLVAGPHARAIAQWHRLQCEGAGRLDVLPVGLLLPLQEEPGSDADPEQRNQPFHAPEPIAVLAAIEDLLAPHLQERLTDPLPDCGDLVSAVWRTANPLAALRALEQANLAAAAGSRQALFQLCDAVCLTHHADVLEAAATQLRTLSPQDVWVRLYRLRLERIRGRAAGELQAMARELLPDAGLLDPGNRQLLATLLSPQLAAEALAQLLPELPAEGLALLQGQPLDPHTAAETAAALLQQARRAGSEQSARTSRCYSVLGASLRSPFQPWDSPEVDDPSRLDQLLDRIAAARRDGRGFALIRLGDGEGCFLAGRSTDLEGATRNGDRLDADLARRGGHLSPEVLSRLQERFRQALLRADVIGIPDLWQCLQGPQDTWRVAAQLEPMLERIQAALWPGGWHLNLQLLRQGAFHRPPFDRIDAVIAAALPPSLRGRDLAFVPLPGEDPHWRGSRRPEAHYPRVHERVLEWISTHVGPGQLVLVGGGLLGKIYVDAIRSRGAVGIDVGSVIDLCCGHSGHRGEHRLNPYLVAQAAEAFRSTP